MKFLVEASAISLAVILATFPIIGFNFQFLSPVGLPATVPVLPALPFVLISSLAVAVAGIFSETAGQILAWGTRAVAFVDDGGDPGVRLGAGVEGQRRVRRPLRHVVLLCHITLIPVVGAADVASGPTPIRAARIPDTARHRQNQASRPFSVKSAPSSF